MSEIADRHRRLCGAFVDEVAQESPYSWGSRSRGENWAALEVVAHLVEAQGTFLRLVKRPFERMANVGDDPVRICFDLAIHGWDLARATGLDETIDHADVVRLPAAVDGFGDALHESGVCGPPVDVATDADDQTRLLALLGRHV